MPPQKQFCGSGRILKKLSEVLAKTVKTEGVKGRSLRPMFQDEARFGRITDPRSCWAPYPIKSVVKKASLVNEYVYAYIAVSPFQDDWDWKICAKMNTECMGGFLNQRGEEYTDDFIIMILDGASSLRAKNLVIPENIRLIPFGQEKEPLLLSHKLSWFQTVNLRILGAAGKSS